MKEEYLIRANKLLPPKKYLSGERNEGIYECARVVARLLEDIDRYHVPIRQYEKTKRLLMEVTRERDVLKEDPMNGLTSKFPGGEK